MNPDPDYSAAYVDPRDRPADGLEGHGLTFTIGRGNEICVRGDRGAGAAGRRPDARVDHRRHGRLLAHDHRRQPAALDRPGEGRDPPGHGGRRQRGLGPVGQGRGQAALEAAGRHDARASSSRCIDFRYITDALTPDEALAILRAQRRRRKAEREARAAARRLSRLHHLGRLARLLRRQAARALPRGARRRAGRTSRSRSARDLDDDMRRCAHHPRGDRPRPQADDRRQPGLGRRRGDRVRCSGWPRSTRGGSRSRPAPTTCSATRAIARGASRRSASRPASTCQNRVMFKQLLQARGDRLLPDRRLPARRRQRGARGAADGGQVRRAGLPARRRRRPVRVRAAPVDVRLHRASAARWRTACIEYVDHLHEHFVDPVVDAATAATCRRRRRATASRCRPNRSIATRFPTARPGRREFLRRVFFSEEGLVAESVPRHHAVHHSRLLASSSSAFAADGAVSPAASTASPRLARITYGLPRTLRSAASACAIASAPRVPAAAACPSPRPPRETRRRPAGRSRRARPPPCASARPAR